jgi:hypothetical protein
MQHFDDLDPSLSEYFKKNNQFYAENHDGLEFFRGLCSLTVISSRTIQRLYSKSGTNRQMNINETLKDLNAQLEEWRRKLPLRIHSLYEAKESSFPTSLARVTLQIFYYQVLTLINRVPLLLGLQKWRRGQKLWFSQPFSEPLEMDLGSEAATVCVDAARESLKLIKDIPCKDHCWTWSVLLRASHIDVADHLLGQCCTTYFVQQRSYF